VLRQFSHSRKYQM